MIEAFKTHCRLPDGSIGEVCKKITSGWLVCNKKGWWNCDSKWILENLINKDEL